MTLGPRQAHEARYYQLASHFGAMGHAESLLDEGDSGLACCPESSKPYIGMSRTH